MPFLFAGRRWFDEEDPLDSSTWHAERGRIGWGPAFELVPRNGETTCGWSAVELPPTPQRAQIIFFVQFNGRVLTLYDGVNLIGTTQQQNIPTNMERDVADFLGVPRPRVKNKPLGSIVARELKKADRLAVRLDGDGNPREYLDCGYRGPGDDDSEVHIYDAPVGEVDTD